MEKTNNKAKLEMWQRRFRAAEDAYSGELALMDARERAYKGTVEFSRLVENESAKAEDIKHIRNVIGELIEAQVDSTVCQPKVTALRPEDEYLAKLAEDDIRNEIERLQIKQLNDLCERITPTQGGVLYLVEWDNSKRTHTTVGEIKLTPLHPKQVIPQDGVYTSIEDMDYIFVKLPQTKEYLRRKYGIDFKDEDFHEEEPEIRSADGDEGADDLCTQYLAYFRNDSGSIGLFSWVLDTVICDYEDYQARKERRCTTCHEPEPPEDENGGRVCPKCGGTEFAHEDSEYEIITEPIETAAGRIEASPTEPVKVRYYKPNEYPIKLRRNVSQYGKFLGGSDVDMIYSQQQTINRTEKAIIDKLLTGGSIITLPPKANIKEDNKYGRCVHLKNIEDKQYIGNYDLTCDITPDLNFLAQNYEEMRQAIGITDSFQGRKDATATSAVAKEFAAKQSAGRLESKREMKNAAWGEIFKTIFKFRLAYTDEVRYVRATDEVGKPIYEKFDRRMYIKRDAAGEYYYDDEFLFSVDAAASLASNREAMWQETRMNLQTGAFGDPSSLETIILFWSKMETLHYPGAAETKRVLENKLREQQEQAQLQAEQAKIQQMQAQQQAAADAERQVREAERVAAEKRQASDEAELRRIDDMARKDAMRDAIEMRKLQQAQQQAVNL